MTSLSNLSGQITLQGIRPYLLYTNQTSLLFQERLKAYLGDIG